MPAFRFVNDLDEIMLPVPQANLLPKYIHTSYRSLQFALIHQNLTNRPWSSPINTGSNS